MFGIKPRTPINNILGRKTNIKRISIDTRSRNKFTGSDKERQEILEEAVAGIQLLDLGFEIQDKKGVKQTKDSILSSLQEQGLISKIKK